MPYEAKTTTSARPYYTYQGHTTPMTKYDRTTHIPPKKPAKTNRIVTASIIGMLCATAGATT